ncbi:DDHD domain-containing protein [Aphelenchoides besseyi]|nr:DDHD domain-containing protein [Aphelenchoides besseyi]
MIAADPDTPASLFVHFRGENSDREVVVLRLQKSMGNLRTLGLLFLSNLPKKHSRRNPHVDWFVHFLFCTKNHLLVVILCCARKSKKKKKSGRQTVAAVPDTFAVMSTTNQSAKPNGSNGKQPANNSPTHSTVPTTKTPKKKVTELECSEVRWFYKDVDHTKWTPFKGYDSMAMELAYRALNDIPLDSKAEHVASEFPKTSTVIVMNNLFEWDPKNEPEIVKSIYWKNQSMKVRRGTWFYADSLQPVAPDMAEKIEEHHIMKFRNQVIPDTPVFSEYEQNKKPVLTTIKWSDHEEVRWNSVIDVVYFNNTKTNRFMRFVTRAKGVYALRRSYNVEADPKDGEPMISDLILVVHGIGQKGYEDLIAKNTTQIREIMEQLMDKHYKEEKRRPMILPIEWRSSLVLDNDLTSVITLPRVPDIRNMLNSIAMDIMYYQSPLYRTEIVNGVIQCLNRTYRTFVNNNPKFNGSVSIFAHSLGSVIAYDIVTNWSPLLLYNKFITNAIEHVVQEEDSICENKKVFREFYDLRKRMLDSSGDPMEDVLLKQDEQLCFKVKNLFCIGSPLGVFVIMRGAQGQFVPTEAECERLFNIFHPYDPVAYRLEPLFHANYKNIRPLKLFNFNEVNRDYDKLGYEVHKSYAKRLKKAAKGGADKHNKNTNEEEDRNEDDDYDSSNDGDSINSPSEDGGTPRSNSPLSPEDELADANAAASANTSSGTRWWKFGSGSTKHDPTHSTNGSSGDKKEAQEKEKEEEKKPTEEKKSIVEQLLDEIPDELRIKCRMDYQLATALTERSWIAVLRSHFSYWTNPDVSAFILNQLYNPAREPHKDTDEKAELPPNPSLNLEKGL